MVNFRVFLPKFTTALSLGQTWLHLFNGVSTPEIGTTASLCFPLTHS